MEKSTFEDENLKISWVILDKIGRIHKIRSNHKAQYQSYSWFPCKIPYQNGFKNRDFIIFEESPAQIRIYWCIHLNKNKTRISNFQFHFSMILVNFFMMVITLTRVMTNPQSSQLAEFSVYFMVWVRPTKKSTGAQINSFRLNISLFE